MRTTPLFVALILGLACGKPPAPPSLPTDLASTTSPGDARDVLETRCVVCHGCYDAPCQLVLSSHEGAERGANKRPVYASSRLFEADPTRLFFDTPESGDWREADFFPVLGAGGSDSGDDLFLRMLALGNAHSFPPDEPLPPQVELDIGRGLSCPTAEEFPAYAESHPLGGMPYGTAGLSADELATLGRWAAQGAPAWPEPPPLDARTQRDVEAWEAFLNGPSLRERIVARYLYEHWFLGHLVFDHESAGPFFEIVRSSTPPGEPIRVIASRRPYDDPGVESFWYRLRRIHSTILHKTHIVYELGEARMARLRELFLSTDWRAEAFPSWDPDEASNPFLSFAAIPPRARYQFLLDDARYFVMTFIRGPVCRGQVAVNVIRDHFWVAFLDPDADLSVADPSFLERATPLLHLPAEQGSDTGPFEIWKPYDKSQKQYLTLREDFYAKLDPKREGPGLDTIWDGDGRDPDALLTVFRHFDNATVVRGFLGAPPQTAWVIDFPIFERIYYDLVAGFDVFGNVAHQVATRLYMDHLRMQAEDLFLLFLPPETRKPLQREWYENAQKQLEFYVDRARIDEHGTRVPYGDGDPMPQLLSMIEKNAGAAAGPPDTLNRCTGAGCEGSAASALARTAEVALKRLAGVRGPWVATLPEVSLVRVQAPESADAVVYTLVHNAMHDNVAFLFGESSRREPAKDTVTLVRGVLGSYPNFVFDVPEQDVVRFAEVLLGVRNDAELETVVSRWGVRRTSPRFWQIMDWLNAHTAEIDPDEAGLLDLNRYGNL